MKSARRFYQSAAVIAGESGFTVTLDDRPVRTPAGAVLAVPTEPLAHAIAAEWESQEETISPPTMPLTGLAATALDRVSSHRREVIDQMAKYAETDLLCYRAESPSELVDRQEKNWQPLLEWLEEYYAAPLAVTSGIAPVDQPEHSILKIRQAIEAMDDTELTVLATVTESTGSLIVAMALLASRISADKAFEFSLLDELFQAERWGDDEDAVIRRRQIKKDILAASTFLEKSRN